MKRRHFTFAAGAALAPFASLATAQKSWGLAGPSSWAGLEAGVQGRLGVAVLDTATGRVQGHRLDERFPMCSTFKWLASAFVLHRVDRGEERLDRRIPYGREVLIAHSPVTEQHVGEGMTLAALCEATVTVSDNAAANLILDSFGGPAGLTAYIRTLGDTQTRLDRTEPALNEARPGDPRDTTTPRAMAASMRACVLGDALSEAGRAQLTRWLKDTTTGAERLRAGVPADWQAGDKTGTGARGTYNDVAVFWPPDRAPLVVAAYLTGAKASATRCNAALAGAARLAVRSVADARPLPRAR
jgi:beta-lactamase class A